MRKTRILLILIAVVCFGVALSYPIRYRLAQDENNANMDELSAMRERARQQATEEPNNSTEGTPETEGASGVETDGSASSGDDAPDIADAPPVEQALTADADAPTGQEAPADAAPSSGMPVRPTLAPEDAAAEAQADATDAADAGEVPTEAADAADVGEVPTEAADAADAGEVPTEAAGAADAGNNQADAPGPGESPAEPQVATPEPTPEPSPTPEPTPWVLEDPTLDDLLLNDIIPWGDDPAQATAAPDATASAPTPEPSPTPPRDEYEGPLPYPMKEKVTLDESRILPELREIYALNRDLVGWIAIPGTVIDYPVVQTQDSDYYLDHDFYGNENINGQIILDTLCDPYTPSYNLVISGHHMKNGSMFGDLPEYRTLAYWEKHKLVEFDTLMERKQYVVFAAFYSADYDEDEEGFRYNVNLEYRLDARQWLAEIDANKLYDTGIDVQFGDEFITLTTCNRARHRNGRFVVVCRRIREGETIE